MVLKKVITRCCHCQLMKIYESLPLVYFKVVLVRSFSFLSPYFPQFVGVLLKIIMIKFG